MSEQFGNLGSKFGRVTLEKTCAPCPACSIAIVKNLIQFRSWSEVWKQTKNTQTKPTKLYKDNWIDLSLWIFNHKTQNWEDQEINHMENCWKTEDQLWNNFMQL